VTTNFGFFVIFYFLSPCLGAHVRPPGQHLPEVNSHGAG
jgi:hypothetical protein